MNARLVVLMISMAILSACSLLLDRRADQCSTDGDCTKFAATRCDQKLRLCVVISEVPDSGNPVHDSGAKEEDAGPGVDACVGPNGCYACPPANDFQFVNGCTDAACKPFDNRARLKNLPADGGLTPLPPQEGGT
jgi:hypothetical protein